jgi:allantoinase
VILRSQRVVLPDGVRAACVHIDGGRIAAIDAATRSYGDSDAIDFGDLVMSPGIVDTHVHVNDPGRTEWEGFDTATRAAAAGGVTTIVDMPLNSVPATTTSAALEAKRSAARGRCHVDVAFWGGVVPGNARDLEPLIDAGARGFKCFLVPSGVDEFPPVDERDLREAMAILARRGVPLLVHAESPAVIERYATALRSADASRAAAGDDASWSDDAGWSARLQPSVHSPSAYAAYLATRPPQAEVEAIRLVVRLAREFGTRVHIVHVASAEAAQEIAGAKAEGVAITAETCPHYLTFAAEQIPDGATEFKCAPPIRAARHREALWAALGDGTLDLIATDHSPAPPALKCAGDFMKAWGGIASLELSLAAVWDAVAGRARLRPSATTVARWMAAAPASLAGLSARKGRIAIGCDADFVVWDPEGRRTVDASTLQQRHKLTPYAGRTLQGTVHATFVRGACVWAGGRLARAHAGNLL